MRKIIATLCSALALYAFLPTAVIVGSSDDSQARGSRGGGRSHVSSRGRSGGGHRGASRPSSRSSGKRDHRTSRDANHGRNANVKRNKNSDRNVNRSRNVNRNVNRDVNVDRDWDADGFWAGAAVGTAVGVGAAAIGSYAYSVPAGCRTVVVNGLTYRDCNGSWYAPRYSGSDIVYEVVGSPY
jgi:hypothetical protein